MSDMTTWADAVQRECGPVFAAAGAGFHEDAAISHGEDTLTLIWMADPSTFLSRYPDSRVDEEHGSKWPTVPDVDFTVTADWGRSQASINIEGWNFPVIYIRLANPVRDSRSLAVLFQRILAVID